MATAAMAGRTAPVRLGRFVRLATCALGLFVLAGCGSGSRDALVDPSSLNSATAPGASLFTGTNDARAWIALKGRSSGHPYFPILPGLYSDYRVTRLGVGLRYVRVTAGEPERFFQSMATPFVYDDVPGQARDSTLYGLRQFYSISPDGDLWFHGAQNNGFMSHTTPPVRMLRANPRPGEAWVDSVLFESFLPGMVPFFQNPESYSWTISEPARLVLPGGGFRGLRSSSVIDDLPALPAARGATRTEAMFMPGSAALESFARRGLGALPEPLRGTWFAHHVGMVARDWPSGQGEVNLNAVTFELVGQGVGPVPPPTPPPIDPGTQ